MKRRRHVVAARFEIEADLRASGAGAFEEIAGGELDLMGARASSSL
jgi:hypothetical protein